LVVVVGASKEVPISPRYLACCCCCLGWISREREREAIETTEKGFGDGLLFAILPRFTALVYCS
jgi:hypothetical protein